MSILMSIVASSGRVGSTVVGSTLGSAVVTPTVETGPELVVRPVLVSSSDAPTTGPQAVSTRSSGRARTR